MPRPGDAVRRSGPASLAKRAAVAVAVMLFAVPACAAQLPSLADGGLYARARRTLAALGYAPKPLSDMDKCADGDTRCYPELEGCSGPGGSGCRYVWIKGDTAIEIATVKEPPIVSGVRCRSACE